MGNNYGNRIAKRNHITLGARKGRGGRKANRKANKARAKHHLDRLFRGEQG